MSLPVVGLPEELHPNSHGEFGFEGRAIALVVDRWGPLGDLLWLEGDCSHEKTGWWFQTGFIFIYFPQYMGKIFPLTISIIFQDASNHQPDKRILDIIYIYIYRIPYGY